MAPRPPKSRRQTAIWTGRPAPRVPPSPAAMSPAAMSPAAMSPAVPSPATPSRLHPRTRSARRRPYRTWPPHHRPTLPRPANHEGASVRLLENLDPNLDHARLHHGQVLGGGAREVDDPLARSEGSPVVDGHVGDRSGVGPGHAHHGAESELAVRGGVPARVVDVAVRRVVPRQAIGVVARLAALLGDGGAPGVLLRELAGGLRGCPRFRLR